MLSGVPAAGAPASLPAWKDTSTQFGAAVGTAAAMEVRVSGAPYPDSRHCVGWTDVGSSGPLLKQARTVGRTVLLPRLVIAASVISGLVLSACGALSAGAPKAMVAPTRAQ